MSDDDQAAELREIATWARKAFTKTHNTAAYDPGDSLSGACLEASRWLRDVLAERGVEAVVRHGYVQIAWPDLRSCPCGGASHTAACRTVAHAWVEAGDWLIDITYAQFADRLADDGRAPALLDKVVVVPIEEAGGRWLAAPPPGVDGRGWVGVERP